MRLQINGDAREVGDAPDRLLLDILRDELGLTGTRFGCGVGLCGACTIMLDGEAARACQTLLSRLEGRAITTIEGLADAERLHPVQQAFVDEQTPQCGYCMSGQIMSAAALLARNPAPSDEEIDAAMRGNLCRCGAYVRIRRAIHRAAALSRGG
jgi:isoquinoline 1-oxidoreductase subunit alpha